MRAAPPFLRRLLRRSLPAAVGIAAIAGTTSVHTAGPDARGLTAVEGLKVGTVTLTERPTGCTVILVDGDGAVGGVDVARRRAGHARDRSARPGQHGRQGQRDRALGRQRLRPRRGDRRGALARGARHRLGRAASPRCRSCRPPSCSTCRSAATRRCGRPPTAATRPPPRRPTAPSPRARRRRRRGHRRQDGRTRPLDEGAASAAPPSPCPTASSSPRIVAVNAVGDIIDPDTGKVVAGARTRTARFADARVLLRARSAVRGAAARRREHDHRHRGHQRDADQGAGAPDGADGARRLRARDLPVAHAWPTATRSSRSPPARGPGEANVDASRRAGRGRDGGRDRARGDAGHRPAEHPGGARPGEASGSVADAPRAAPRLLRPADRARPVDRPARPRQQRLLRGRARLSARAALLDHAGGEHRRGLDGGRDRSRLSRRPRRVVVGGLRRASARSSSRSGSARASARGAPPSELRTVGDYLEHALRPAASAALSRPCSGSARSRSSPDSSSRCALDPQRGGRRPEVGWAA